MIVGVTALLIGVVLLFAVPIDVAFVVRRDERLRGRVTVGWLFGLVRISVYPASSAARARPSRRPSGQIVKRHRKRRRARNVGSMLLSEGFLARVLRLLHRLLSRIHVRRLYVHIRLGLDDPADTGRLWGMVGPLVCVVPTPATGTVAIEPDFTGEAFHVDGEGAVRIVPIEIIVTLLAFALSPITWRALRALSAGK